MKISRTFDIFWSLPKKLFKNPVPVKVTHIETPAIGAISSVHADVTNNSITMNVYNSQKVYSLLTSVLYKKKLLNENQDGQIYYERTYS